MLRLIGAELYKIFSKKIVLAGILLIIVLNHMMFDGWMTTTEVVMNEDGTYVEGKEAIALDQKIAKQYEGKLTDDKVRQIIESYALPEGYGGSQGPAGLISRNNMYSTFWDFHDEYGNYNGKTIQEEFGEQADSLYVAYNKSWSNASYYLGNLFLMGIAYLLIISVTPVFSEEYTRGTDALILTSRYGKSKCAWAKVAAVFVYTFLIGTVCLLVNSLLFLVNYGTEGWNGSLQLNYIGIYHHIPYEINFAQAGIYAVLLWIGASFMIAGVSLLISAYSKSSFVALIICALLYTVPMFFTGEGNKAAVLLSLFPIKQLQLSCPFETGRQTVIVCYALAAAILCGLIAKRAFSRHQVSA